MAAEDEYSSETFTQTFKPTAGMDKTFQQEISQFLSLADFIRCEVVIGIKLTLDGHMIWATNGMKMKEKLLTEGLRFDDDSDEFFEGSLIKEENFSEDEDDDFLEAGLKNDKVVGDLKMRLRTHTRPFKCLQCSKSFKRSYNLKRHNLTHTGEEPIKCLKGEKPSKCIQRFKPKRSPKNRKEKPLKCSQCSKAFRDSYALLRHLQTHTGEKPFKCSQCSKSFRSSQNLKIHHSIHTGERPFHCSQCSKCFRNKRSLKVHLLTHSSERPFKCLQCSKTFSVGQNLKIHMQIHTGEKPFECVQCSKSFRRAHDLKLHIQTHTGEKPFKCPHCPKSYVRPDKLKKHLSTHVDGGTSPLAIKRAKRDQNQQQQQQMGIMGQAQPAAHIIHQYQPLPVQNGGNAIASLGTPTLSSMRNNVTKTQRFNPMTPPTSSYVSAGSYDGVPAMAMGNDPNMGHTLFVYNIGAVATEIDLYTLFGPFGAIIKVHIQHELSTGADKGFGFVTFSDYNNALLAVQAMNGYPFEKNALKPLQVCFKSSKLK